MTFPMRGAEASNISEVEKRLLIINIAIFFPKNGSVANNTNLSYLSTYLGAHSENHKLIARNVSQCFEAREVTSAEVDDTLAVYQTSTKQNLHFLGYIIYQKHCQLQNHFVFYLTCVEISKLYARAARETAVKLTG